MVVLCISLPFPFEHLQQHVTYNNLVHHFLSLVDIYILKTAIMAANPDPNPISTLLRRTCIVTYPFAFSLGIAHAAISSNGLFPAIALVPQTVSAIFSVSLLYLDVPRRSRKHASSIRLAVGADDEDDGGDKPMNSKVMNLAIFLGDFMIVGGLLTCMVFAWLSLGTWQYRYYGYYSCRGSETVLGTYATVPFMINM